VRTFLNPFRVRASEQQRDTHTFLRHFGSGVLDLLPETIWDRPLVLRSAPGGGKTSLLRLFTAESLATVHERREDLADLHARLVQLGALTEDGPAVLGILLPLDADYRALLDTGLPEESARRLFFRLLDMRIVVAAVRAALGVAARPFPQDAGSVEFVVREEARAPDDLAQRFGGLAGDRILERARDVEERTLEILDALYPVDVAPSTRGHGDLYSLRLLASADILVDGRVLNRRPLLLLDDGHDLGPSQRRALLERLWARNLTVPRWYAERLEALSDQDVLQGDIEGRDHEMLELESAAGSRGRRFESTLLDVGNLRGVRKLEQYAASETTFFELLDFDEDALLDDRQQEILRVTRAQVAELAGDDRRYAPLLREADGLTGYRGAVRLRELQVLIERDSRRATRELFDLELSSDELDRLGDSSTRAAAKLFLAAEFNLTYYAGPPTVAGLGSRNIEQFLTLCADLFEEMLAEITLGHRPAIAPGRQHRILVDASHGFWHELPRRVPHGRDVQRLLERIAEIAKRETYRPNAPYAPGVTGIALTMSERDRLLDEDWRARTPGAERLFRTMAAAISHNVLSADPDKSVKGDRHLVLYLNRLLCPRFGLPLQRSGFSHQRLPAVLDWLGDQPEASRQLDLSIDR